MLFGVALKCSGISSPLAAICALHTRIGSARGPKITSIAAHWITDIMVALVRISNIERPRESEVWISAPHSMKYECAHLSQNFEIASVP